MIRFRGALGEDGGVVEVEVDELEKSKRTISSSGSPFVSSFGGVLSAAPFVAVAAAAAWSVVVMVGWSQGSSCVCGEFSSTGSGLEGGRSFFALFVSPFFFVVVARSFGADGFRTRRSCGRDAAFFFCPLLFCVRFGDTSLFLSMLHWRSLFFLLLSKEVWMLCPGNVSMCAYNETFFLKERQRTEGMGENTGFVWMLF